MLSKCPCFFVILVLMYVIIYFQFLSKLRDDIWVTEGIINLIPTKLLIENKKLATTILKKTFD